MTDDLGSKMMALNSLYYTHYFAKTGVYTAIGAGRKIQIEIYIYIFL